ncbi:hypothetical protein Ahy_A08g040442 [Arachis hypogaea]|uniref:Uncharacterized protein n=1 Tax=Arachis hypogaea TaxID=3818 RepID=A0A445BZ86_ARAHY|nr:hypothetical protein Ahy_A08g040442 [Arachis hypogaea]
MTSSLAADTAVPEVGEKFIWDKTYDAMIRKIFGHWMARRLQRMMCNHFIIWLHTNIKKTLYVHWETDEGFRYCRLTSIANRASASSLKYTGRSATFMKIKARLESYTQRLEAATQQSQHTGEDSNKSANSVVNPYMVWRDTAFEPYKNRVYGLGSFFTNNLCISILRASSASITIPVEVEDSIDLRFSSCINLKRGIMRSSHAC